MKKINKSTIIIFLFFIVFTAFLSIAVSNRDLNAVEDNINYMNNFFNKNSFNSFNYEYLFDLTTFSIRKFTDSYIIYFFLLNVLLNGIIFFTGFKIAKFYNASYEFLFILAFILIFSSWYYSSATNGLRQGLSLAIFYLSLIYLVLYKKIKTFTILMIISFFFHYSTILMLPFILLYRLSLRNLFLLSGILGLSYVAGINENLVKFISNILGLPLYEQIKYYSESADSYSYGFELNLFLYTFCLSIIYFFIEKRLLPNTPVLHKMLKIFLFLTIPYYIFGFAGYSNRFGLMSWFFTIFMNTLIYYLLLKKNRNIFYIVFVSTFFVSILYFLKRYLNFL